MPYVYMLKCADDTLYTGSCVDIGKRLKQHNGLLKGGAKYTRGRRPVLLVYIEQVKTQSEALRRENQIKQLTRIDKEKLFLNNAS